MAALAAARPHASGALLVGFSCLVLLTRARNMMGVLLGLCGVVAEKMRAPCLLACALLRMCTLQRLLYLTTPRTSQPHPPRTPTQPCHRPHCAGGGGGGGQPASRDQRGRPTERPAAAAQVCARGGRAGRVGSAAMLPSYAASLLLLPNRSCPPVAAKPLLPYCANPAWPITGPPSCIAVQRRHGR